MKALTAYRENSRGDDHFVLVLLLLPLGLCLNWSFQGALPFWVLGLLLSWASYPYYQRRTRLAWGLFFGLLLGVVAGNALLQFGSLPGAWAFLLGKLLLFALALPTAAHFRAVGERN